MSSHPHEHLLAELRAAVGESGMSSDDAARSLHRRDASTFAGCAPITVCYPTDTDQVVGVVRACARAGVAFVTRGSGTGLAGGAVPLDAAVVIVTTRMNRILEVDVDNRVAWVQPGVLNLDLSRHVAPLGLHFAPDPSSQAACSIGGNIATNSGGPHCLAEGVTSAHVVELELVLADGTLTRLGGLDPEPDGLDLRGAVVGSEGTMGLVTRAAVRLTPVPPAVRTLLGIFDDLDAAAEVVTGIIAASIVPAALEMVDGPLAAVLEDHVAAGWPRDAAAVLLIELDGIAASVDVLTTRVAEIARIGGARGGPRRSRRRGAAALVDRRGSPRSEPSLGSLPTTTSTTPSCLVARWWKCSDEFVRSRRPTTCRSSTCSTPGTATSTRCSSSTAASRG